MTREQIRQLIAEQLKDTPNWADNRIAGEFGVDGKTVGAVRAKLEATSEIPKLNGLVGADGKERAAKRPRPRKLKLTGDEWIGGSRGLTGCTTSDLDAYRAVVAPELGAMSPASKAEMFDAGMSKRALVNSFGGLIHLHDPADDLSEAELQAWARFNAFLIEHCGWDSGNAGGNIDWMLRHDFKTPEEWLGDDGDKYRKRCGMRPMPNEIKEAWVHAPKTPVAHARQPRMAEDK